MSKRKQSGQQSLSPSSGPRLQRGPVKRMRAAAKPSQTLRHLPPFGSPATPPITASSRVAVLLRGDWAPLHARLEQELGPENESEALNALESLIRTATPVLAQRALQAHMLAQAAVYRQWNLHAWAFHPLAPQRQHDWTIWGVSLTDNVIVGTREALTSAAQARARLPDLPCQTFWPLVGGFFNAVDSSPLVSPARWAALNTAPEQYTLLELLVIARYGELPKMTQLPITMSTLDHADGWRLCLRCGCAAWEDELIEWDNHHFCPYWCGGEIRGESRDWAYACSVNPTFPHDPVRWVIYPMYETSA